MTMSYSLSTLGSPRLRRRFLALLDRVRRPAAPPPAV
jgi:hypothetical protein